MPLDRRTPVTLDTDTAPESVANGRASALLNVVPEAGYLATLRGNVALPVTLPPGQNRTVAEVELPGTGGGLVWLVWNSEGAHSALRQLPPAAPELLLTWAGLNLPPLAPGTYLAPTVLDTFLLYLDADGEARNLPLPRLAAGEYGPARLAAEPYGLHLLKVPPTQPPGAFRVTLAGDDPRLTLKLVSQKAWQFSYRWHYVDGETTVLAPFSEWLDMAEDPSTSASNAITLTLLPTPLGVDAVDVLVRTPGDVGWKIVDTCYRTTAGTLPTTYTFYGLSSGSVVQGDDATRLFESLWPSKALTAARNRAWTARPRIGYPTPEPAFTAVSADTGSAELRTFHENSAYRVVVQYYDALGRSGGCSAPVTVFIPPQRGASPTLRSIQVILTTQDAAALNAEIPSWAVECQFLVARNDRTVYFLQGRAADALGYLGQKRTVHGDNTITETHDFTEQTRTHEKLWVDIGNFPAVGQGYAWQPGSGDVLRFLREGKQFVITQQVGDYLEVQYDGVLQNDADGQTKPLIEIFSPNLTASQLYYERGPRIPILRRDYGQGEQRNYGQRNITLAGDCFVVPLYFPTIKKTEAYLGDANNNKEFESATTPTFVESMVPPYRLAPTSTTTTIVHEETQRGIFDGGLLGLISDHKDVVVATTSTTTANVAARTAANLLWLDMSYGGRPGVRLPLALQQVTLEDAVCWSGTRLAGSLLNGLSTWQAADQRELAREQGPIQALIPATDVQSEDQLLLAVCTLGAVSIGVGISQVRQASGGTITADTSSVIGYVNSQQSGLGTRHPRSVRGRSGRVYWWCEDQGETCRYAADGVNDLNTQHQCRTLGQELATTYAGGLVTGTFDRYTKEYILCFAPAEGEAPPRTVRYSERAKGFVGDAGYAAEAVLGTSKGRLVSFVAGLPWEHVAGGPRMSFYNFQHAAEVRVWANDQGNYSKTFLAVEVESGPERWTLARAETPSGQYTWLPAARLERLEDRWHAPLLMDATSPGFPAGTDGARRALYEGVPVQGLALNLTWRCVSAAPTVRLLAVGVEYFINGGQSAPQ